MSFNGDLYPSDDGLNITTKGSIHTSDGSTNKALAVSGNNGYVLAENSGVTDGIEWILNAHSSVTPSSTTTFTNKSIDFGTNTMTSTLAQLDTALSTTGTASSSTFLRGDNSWATAGGGNLKLLENETLASDTSAWNLTFSSAYDFNDYSNFWIILETDADGTSGATDLSMQLNGNTGNNYHWIMQDWITTTQTLSNGVAQPAFILTQNYVQQASNYTWLQLMVNDFPTGERYGQLFSSSIQYTSLRATTAYATLGATVTDFSQILFTEEGDGDFLADSRLTIYGFER